MADTVVRTGSDSNNENQPLSTFACGGFIHGSVWSNVMLVTMISLPVMFLLISIGMHSLLVILAFVFSIFALLKWRSGHMTYSLYDWGFEQYVVPSWAKKQPILRKFKWENVLSYQVGADMSRGLREYNYLKIKLNQAPHKIQLSDAQADLDQFLAFKDQFEELVNHYNSNVSTSTPVGQVKRRKDFYQTFWAKLITAFFIALCVGLIWFAINADSIRTTNLYRIVAVIIPGTMYMAYRVFFRKGR
ncbi:MAG: hypothetical protein H6606_03560 [Flavobacteriales bacterium]|nr:hypothetical protein [Flavobacteriales bacterium]